MRMSLCFMKSVKALFRAAVAAGFVPGYGPQIKPRVGNQTNQAAPSARQMVCMICETGQNPRQPITMPATGVVHNEAISQ